MALPEPQIRPIRAADLELEKEFVDGLSPATGYQRLMSTRRLSLGELKRFTDIDPAREGALIATVVVDSRERQVGVARYVRDERAPHTAEFAIVLADAWQRRGLGRRLLALARKMGFRTKLDPESAAITVLTLECIE